MGTPGRRRAARPAGSPQRAAAAAAADAQSEVPTDEAGYQLVQKFETTIQVTSTAFNDIRRISKTNACVEVEFVTGAPSTNVKSKRENKSTPLTWGELPEGTVSVALVVDSDQGTTVGVHKPVYLDPTYFDKFQKGAKWVHWVIWNVPADAGGLDEGVPTTTAALPDVGPQAMQGTNSELGDRLLRAVPAARHRVPRQAGRRPGQVHLHLHAVCAGQGDRGPRC